LDNLPVIPEVVRRFMGMLHDPLTSMSDVSEVISQDASLTLRVLHVSNSVYYGGLQEIKDIRHACSRLGMKTVANIVLTDNTQQVYRNTSGHSDVLTERLWKHAIAAAYCAEKLDAFVEPTRRSSVYLGGLMHDVGKVALLDQIFRRYKGRLGRLRDDVQLLVRVLNTFHDIIGLMVAQHWKLSPEVRCAVLFHNHPERCPAPEWESFAHDIAVANRVAWTLGYGIDALERPMPNDVSTAHLGLTPEQLTDLFATAKEDLESLTDAYAFT
jgi:HD-like signal output (HDOD) protein